jgi:Domain of unknown function (DUF1707)
MQAVGHAAIVPVDGSRNVVGVDERSLPDLRASDADRERAAETLRRAGGAGQLDVEELGERLDAAYAARTRGELDRLLADLAPAATDPGARVAVRPGEEGTRWVVSVMGGSDRRGRWRVGRRCTVVNVMGGSDLDLNDAELAAEVVELRVFSLMGGSDVWVPEGLDVEVSEFAFMGGNELRVEDARPAERGGPVLRLRLVSVMGGTTVRRGRKRSRRERRLERERRRELGSKHEPS